MREKRHRLYTRRLYNDLFLGMTSNPTIERCGRYELVELVSRGRFTDLYRARARGVEGFEKEVAVKRLRREWSERPALAEAFVRHSRLALSLVHVNIVQLIDVGSSGATLYQAKEWVKGFSTRQMLDRASELGVLIEWPAAVALVAEVARGLDYAHRRRDAKMRPLNIVHGGVRPENILVSAEGEIKLTDTGLTAVWELAERDAGIHVPVVSRYAPPEPERNIAGDVYACGLVLAEVLLASVGLTPTPDRWARLREGNVGDLMGALPDLPEDVLSLLERLLEVDPRARLMDTAELFEELNAVLYQSQSGTGAQALASWLEKISVKDPVVRAGLPETFVDEPSAAHNIFALLGKDTDAELSVPVTPRPSQRPFGDIRRTVVLALAVPASEFDAARSSSIGLDAPVDASLAGSFRLASQRYGLRRLENEPSGLFVSVADEKPNARHIERAASCALSVLDAARHRDGSPEARLVMVEIEHEWASGTLVGGKLSDAAMEKVLALLGLAGLGEIAVDRDLTAALSPWFSYQSRDSHLVLERRSTSGALGTRWMGRKSELSRFRDECLLASQHGLRLISVVGAEGSGKTRFLREAMRRIRKRAPGVSAYFVSFAGATQLAPREGVAALFRSLLGVRESDDLITIDSKLARLRALGLSEVDQLELRRLAGMGPEVAADEGTARALAHLLRALCRDGLTVVFMDAAENLDELSFGLFGQLVGELGKATLALVFASRDGRRIARLGERDAFTIELGDLGVADVGDLSCAMFGAERAEPELVSNVVEMTAGRPLLLVEYLSALRAAGALNLDGGTLSLDASRAAELPRTFQDRSKRRFLALSDDERRVLQVAATMGERFSCDQVSHVLGADANDVEATLEGLVRGRWLIPDENAEYEFPHGSYRKTVEASLPLGSQAVLHKQVGAALEASAPQPTSAMCTRIAWHLKEAHDFQGAAGWLIRASDKLEQEASHSLAFSSLCEALGLLQKSRTAASEEICELYFRIGQAAYRSRRLEEGMVFVKEAYGLAESRGDEGWIARFALQQGRLLVNAGQLEEGRRWLARAAELTFAVREPALRRDVALASAEASTRLGLPREAVEYLREALSLSRGFGDGPVQLRCLLPLCLAYASTGENERARETLSDANALLGEHSDPFSQTEVEKARGLVAYCFGELETAQSAFERALALARDFSFPREEAVSGHNLGETLVRQKDYPRAFAVVRASQELCVEHGYAALYAANQRLLGYLEALEHDADAGRQMIEESLRFADEHGMRWDAIQARHTLARLFTRQGRKDEARQSLLDARKLALEVGDRASEREIEHDLLAL